MMMKNSVMWIQENEVSLKTKEDALTELDFLRTNPWDVSKNRLFNFLREKDQKHYLHN